MEPIPKDHPLIRHAGLHPDFREEIACYYQNRPYSLQIESTLACGQGCRYCYAGSDNPPEKELPAAAIRGLIDAAAGMGIQSVDWLGGDPLLRDDWEELMTHAQRLGLSSSIWSSGLPLADPETAKRAVAASKGGFVSVHLDSLDPAIYSVLHTGSAKEKIRTILRSVDLVQAAGKLPEEMINCITLTRPVAGEDIRRTIRFFREEKGMRTCLTLLVPAGSACRHPEWIPDRRAIRDAYEERNRANFEGDTLGLGPMDVSKFYCAGTVCVTVDGDVTPCSVIRKSYGNIFEEPFEAIARRNRDELLFTRLRTAGNYHGSCTTCSQGMVCWGCRASAWAATGDTEAPDPYCWMAGTEAEPDERK